MWWQRCMAWLHYWSRKDRIFKVTCSTLKFFPRFFSDLHVKAGGFWIKSGFSGRQPRDTLFWVSRATVAFTVDYIMQWVIGSWSVAVSVYQTVTMIGTSAGEQPGNHAQISQISWANIKAYYDIAWRHLHWCSSLLQIPPPTQTCYPIALLIRPSCCRCNGYMENFTSSWLRSQHQAGCYSMTYSTLQIPVSSSVLPMWTLCINDFYIQILV